MSTPTRQHGVPRGRGDGTYTLAAPRGADLYGPPAPLLPAFDPVSADLYPTKTRLDLLAQVAHPAGLVACEAGQVRSVVAGVVSALAKVLARAGWLREDHTVRVGNMVPVVLTKRGREVLAEGLAQGKVRPIQWP